MNNRSFKIKRIPESFGGGWNLQLIEDGRIVKNHKEPENFNGIGIYIGDVIVLDLAFHACQLNGDLWIRERGLSV